MCRVAHTVRQVSLFRELCPDRPVQHDELDHCDGAGCVLCGSSFCQMIGGWSLSLLSAAGTCRRTENNTLRYGQVHELIELEDLRTMLQWLSCCVKQ